MLGVGPLEGCVLRTADCGLGRAAQSTRSHVFPQVGPLGFSSELFFRAFVTICDRLDLTSVPGHDLRVGAHRGQPVNT